ncbi:MAG: GNAT family N-acetyltransferase [Pseudomonadales bacterium]
MIDILPLEEPLLDLFNEHFERHRRESGQGEPHFMPFAVDDPEGPRGLQSDALHKPLSELNWQRWFVALSEASQVVGHVDLKGDGLHAGSHRCELGIGIERAFRAQGLGRALMEKALGFARSEPQLHWVDLRVFAHNTGARALYRALQFEEVGVLRDRFRVQGSHIDDVLMCLSLRQGG